MANSARDQAVRMPAVFIGHGNPMNAIEDNPYAAAWRELADSIPRPEAILSVSAHWYVPGGRVTAEERPATLHDFGGFPPALFDVQYPAPGSPELAARVCELLAPAPIELDTRWGTGPRHLVRTDPHVPGCRYPRRPAGH
jgi:4,5-DOPA dioxygenase extradiol